MVASRAAAEHDLRIVGGAAWHREILRVVPPVLAQTSVADRSALAAKSRNHQKHLKAVVPRVNGDQQNPGRSCSTRQTLGERPLTYVNAGRDRQLFQ